MGSGLLVMLREGLEAALIVAIVLAYLKRLGREGEFPTVWTGVGAGVGLSIVAGIVVFAAIGGLEGRGEEITEGVVAFTAVGVLSWMIFWMARQAKYIKGDLQRKVDAALEAGSAKALAAIAFVAILREGLESALFLLGTTVGEESSGAQFLGGLIGLAIAAGIGYLVYRGSRRVNLRLFFRVTGLLILLFAAGLLAKGVHEFQEAGFIPTATEHVYDVSSVTALNPDESQGADFLQGLFGWSPNPSIEMLVVYFLYLIPVGTAFMLRTRSVPALKAAPATEPQAA
ncbi:MAG: iron uptake transporter permease EfeU [Actinomycetota bacterium]